MYHVNTILKLHVTRKFIIFSIEFDNNEAINVISVFSHALERLPLSNLISSRNVATDVSVWTDTHLSDKSHLMGYKGKPMYQRSLTMSWSSKHPCVRAINVHKVHVLLKNNTTFTQQFHRNFSLAFYLVTNSLSLNSAYYYIFSNLPMAVYIIEIQKSKFANI